MEAPLEQLVSRLEAVTARLEALSSITNSPEQSKTRDFKDAPNEQGVIIVNDINHTEAVIQECLNEKGVSVTAFDIIYNDKFAAYVALSAKIGGEVNEQAALVKKAFDSLRQLLSTAESNAKPSDADFPKFLKPLGECIGEVSNYRETKRASKLFNHLSTVSEAIGALGWVSVSPTPGPFAKEMADAGQFYANRVIKEYKEKDQDHVTWVRTYQGIWSDLIAYIKQHHTTGLTWNAKAGGAPPPPPPGGAPPPPPPVAAHPVAPVGGGSDPGAGRTALLDALSKGTDITSGLKKVSNDMKTHKNPALRAKNKVPAAEAPAKHVPSSVYVPKPFKVSKPTIRPVAPKKAPVLTLEGNKKWVVENHENNPNVLIDKTNLKHTVYIYNCKGSTITIKGKVNGVTLDSCKKTAVVVDDLISALEFVNCQSVQAQIHGELHLVSIDKTDGIQIYLSNASKNAEVVSAKSSEMNVLVPKDDGDFAEFALPEQYKSVWDGKGFVTTPTDS